MQGNGDGNHVRSFIHKVTPRRAKVLPVGFFAILRVSLWMDFLSSAASAHGLSIRLLFPGKRHCV